MNAAQIPSAQAVAALAALGWTPGGLAAATAGAEFLSVGEAATRLGVGKRTIWAAAAAGRLPRVRVGRVVRFRASDVDGLRETDGQG